MSSDRQEAIRLRVYLTPDDPMWELLQPIAGEKARRTVAGVALNDYALRLRLQTSALRNIVTAAPQPTEAAKAEKPAAANRDAWVGTDLPTTTEILSGWK